MFNSTKSKATITFYPTGLTPVVLTCEVAKTFSEKTMGLMYRSSLPDEKGMLFPFLFSWFRLFWMRNVSIPLDIIFVDKNLKVVKICEGARNAGFFNRKFWAYGFCKYVIECNKGFCKTYHIGPGAKVFYSPKNVNTN